MSINLLNNFNALKEDLLPNKYSIPITDNNLDFLLSYNRDLRSGTVWLYLDLSWLYRSFTLACLVLTRIV